MKKRDESVPHFLRFTQALARVSGIGLPSAALLVAAACGGQVERGGGGVSIADAGGILIGDTGKTADTRGLDLGIDTGLPVPDATLGMGVEDSSFDIGIVDTGPEPDAEPDTSPAPGLDSGAFTGMDAGAPVDARSDAELDSGMLFGIDAPSGIIIDGGIGAIDAHDSDATDSATVGDAVDEASLSGGGPCDFPDLPA